VRRVLDRDGNLLVQDLELLATGGAAPGAGAPPEPTRALDPRVAFVVADLLRGAIDEPDGTGHRAISLGRGVAGKTGTTDDYRDAWFVGFSPEVVTGVWVGYDRPRPLGRDATGGRAALPIWSRTMKGALDAAKPRWPWPPRGVAYHRFDVDTGGRPDEATRRSCEGAFLVGTEPVVSAVGQREEISEQRAALLAELAPEAAAASP
jgi:penicillin-binding protein 1A